MKTGNGKIANLPADIREQLNYRLNDGEPGNELVAWLNSKPEVKEVLRKRFDGKPISEQNLSQWRTHGYRQWHAYHNIVDSTNELTGNTEGIAKTGIDCEKLLLTLTASYADMIQRWITMPPDEMTYKLRVFKDITNAVLALRRAEIQKARLEIERERLELLREKERNKSASSARSPRSTSVESVPARQPQPNRQPAVSSPHPENSAPNRSKNEESGQPSKPAVGAAVTGKSPTSPPATAATPAKPAAPQDAPLWPTRRPGGSPPNATPRNPLGLL